MKFLQISLCLLLSFFSFFLRGQDCNFGSCSGYTTLINLAQIPDCATFIDFSTSGDIDNNSTCDDNGNNCYQWIITKPTSSNVESLTMEIGQGNGCNGEVDNLYLSVDGQCIDYGSTGSQNEIVVEFGQSDTLKIILCDGSSGQVSICSLCANFPALSVELSDFSARKTLHNEVILSWTTFTETNNAGFLVQKSRDLEIWEDLDFITGKGDSEQVTDYTFSDTRGINATSYYRLKQLDLDGTYSYSQVVNISVYPEVSLHEIIENGIYFNAYGQRTEKGTGLFFILYKNETYKVYLTE